MADARRRSGLPSGRARATNRSCASSSNSKHIDAFLPTITRWSRWKDRKKKIDWPLFPGYCFARFDPERHAADPEVHRASSTSCRSKAKPAPIPEHEIDSIRVLVGSELQFDPCPLIHEGMMVEVVHGPLKGVIGRLMRKDAQRAGWCCRSI